MPSPLQEYKLSDFDYPFDASLIAQQPLQTRSASRLLAVDIAAGQIAHKQFSDLLSYLRPGDRLVLNNTAVIPARIRCQKITGGGCEILIERLLNATQALAHARANKPLRIGTQFVCAGVIIGRLLRREGDLFVIEFSAPIMQIMAKFGETPLPPYIDRAATADDLSRYQTVFASEPGAVAAPTAGLHFDNELLASLKAQQVDISYLTLHVGAGTFQPVRHENLDAHVMHAEFVHVGQQLVDEVIATKRAGGRIIAVGTTVVRALESAAQQQGGLQEFVSDTQIFIRPGFNFKVIDALVTNFHLPKTTLMMLVSAFANVDLIKQAYAQAVAERYRFFSYGDAMFLCNRALIQLENQ